MTKKPYMILIRDGWGYNPDFKGNAIHKAKTPNHNEYIKKYPTALIVASGENVGLPSANQGSSEVGHLNMGAGRVVYQSLVRINNSIDDGSFFENETIMRACEQVKKTGSNIHLWGLVQDQGVHAHNNHLKALLKIASKAALKKEQVIIHVFADGRDTPPKSTKKYIKDIENSMNENKIGVFGSIMGRYFSMDRDNRWERVKLAYDMLANGIAEGSFDSIYDAIDNAYSNEETDEFIKPRIIKNNFKYVSDNDTVIFFNYRLDRTRELTRAFVEDGFSQFETKKINNLNYVCFTEYYDGVKNSTRVTVSVVFPPIQLNNLFGDYLSKHNLKQLRIAETEKFAHVTFFFNGQSDVVFEGEDRILVPSPKVATYDLQPEMSAYIVRDKVIAVINQNKYDVIVLNFANPDMVGHTGVFGAAIRACEVVDSCVGDVVNAILSKDGVVLLTADHGNADQMIDYSSGGIMTAHTSHLVWATLISNREDLQKNRISLKASGGKLADIAPTIIDVMGMEKPSDMEGVSLINHT